MGHYYDKDILAADVHRLKGGGRFEVSPDDLRQMEANFRHMRGVGLRVLLCDEHQPVLPSIPEQVQMSRSMSSILGSVDHVWVGPDHKLWARLSAKDGASAERLRATKWTSPEIRKDYSDRSGWMWPGMTLSHLAVTTDPVQRRQHEPRQVRLSRLSYGDAYQLSWKPMREVRFEQAGPRTDQDALSVMLSMAAEMDGIKSGKAEPGSALDAMMAMGGLK